MKAPMKLNGVPAIEYAEYPAVPNGTEYPEYPLGWAPHRTPKGHVDDAMNRVHSFVFTCAGLRGLRCALRVASCPLHVTCVTCLHGVRCMRSGTWCTSRDACRVSGVSGLSYRLG